MLPHTVGAVMDYNNHDAVLEADIKAVKDDVKQLKADVREVRDTMLRYKGFIGGLLFAASCFGAIITLVIQHFWK